MSQPSQTPAERLQLADVMTADSWRIAEAARQTLAAALLAPWLRGRREDAAAHRELQRRLHGLFPERS